jgi:alanine dehydrogenase
MQPLILDGETVERLLDPGMLLDRLEEAFIALSRGEIVAPARIEVATAKGYSLSMPAYRPGGPIMVKIVNVFEGNPAVGLPSHQAVICLFDADTGSCTAILDGTAITALRTAAAAALSTRLLAREDAQVLTIVGAGAQAQAHLKLMPLARNLREIRIASRRYEDAQRLAEHDQRGIAVESSEEAVRSSDIVSLCTNAGTAAIDASWVRPGTHLTSVGYREPNGELPSELLSRATLFVETRLAFEPFPTGCFELAGLAPEVGTELGEVLQHAKPGRTSRDQVTVYKAMGHALEDLVAAELVVDGWGLSRYSTMNEPRP